MTAAMFIIDDAGMTTALTPARAAELEVKVRSGYQGSIGALRLERSHDGAVMLHGPYVVYVWADPDVLLEQLP